MSRVLLLLVGSVVSVQTAIDAQAPVALSLTAGALQHASFGERIHSEISAQTGDAEVRRSVDRYAIFSTAVRHDTVVVTADTISLGQTLDGAPQAVDVDAVIGGRWLVVVGSDGVARVVDRPFVPERVADASDVARAMDDFFPPAPPPLAVNARVADDLHRIWRRLADSAGAQRYLWGGPTHVDSTYTAGDSVTVHNRSDTDETSSVTWSTVRGPLAWVRKITTTVTSQFAGRTLRAVVEQRIVVRRMDQL